MKQNFIAQMNAFDRWLETNYLPTAAQLLWYKLFVLFNKCGWEEWIQVDNLKLMLMIGVKSEKSAILARDKLLEANLIDYQKGKKNKPNRYRMIYFDCKNYSKNDSISDSENDSENAVYPTVNATAINKQNKTKTKQNNICDDGCARAHAEEIDEAEEEDKLTIADTAHRAVMLTDRQMDDLLERLTLDEYNYYVEKLGAFIEEKGAHVKNHYETILKWVAEDRRNTGGTT